MEDLDVYTIGAAHDAGCRALPSNNLPCAVCVRVEAALCARLKVGAMSLPEGGDAQLENRCYREDFLGSLESDK